MLANAGTLTTISERFHVSRMALSRHRANHLKTGAKAADERIGRLEKALDEAETPKSSLEAVDHLQGEIWRLLRALRTADVPAGQVRTELQAVRELREGIALRARLTGEIGGERGGRPQAEADVAAMSDAQLVEEYERLQGEGPEGRTVN